MKTDLGTVRGHAHSLQMAGLVAVTPKGQALLEEIAATLLSLASERDAAQAEAARLKGALQNVLDEVWDGRNAYLPAAITCETAYKVLQSALAPAEVQP